MARRRYEGLTSEQEELFVLLRDHLERSTKQPTVRLLASELGIVSSAVNARLQALIEKGFVKSAKTGTRDRVLSILKKLPSEELVSVPILGKIACGAPIWVEENFDGEVLLPKDRLGSGDFFALRTEGDSMINAGIDEGDLVVIRQQPMAENGEIVAAYINGEVTLKRLSFKNNMVTLNPENESYAPIVVAPDADFRILGVFKMVSKVRKSTIFTHN